jgi:hypothetical protein
MLYIAYNNAGIVAANLEVVPRMGSRFVSTAVAVSLGQEFLNCT